MTEGMGAGMTAAALRALRLQALQQRASGQPPLVQALLAERVQALGALTPVPPAPAPVRACAALGALGALVSQVAARPGAVNAPGGELAALQRGRSTWERLSASQRVQQALAQVPQQAGPLNTSHLVHRALGLMQAVSPGYLQHFVPYVDALLWLQAQQGAPAPASKKAAPRAAPKIASQTPRKPRAVGVKKA